MRRPNVLFIIADDLGYSDVGCYGGEIETPNIDGLSQDGVRLLNFHTAAACSPTRAMVLAGTDAHKAGLGCLIEWKNNPARAARYEGKRGYEGFMNHDVAPLSEILEDNGYYTALSGKWHLGMRDDAGPWARGFQKSFSMLPGCSNHWGWEPLLENGDPAMKMGGRPLHTENGLRADVKPNKNEDGFYSSTCYANKMVEYLSSRNESDKEKPFFGYLAFSAPHWPLQASKAKIAKYRGMYDDGPHALRTKRLRRMQDMGIIVPEIVPHDVISPSGEWEDFNEYQRKCSSRAMEAYAGMVEQMDDSIGVVLDYLKSTGEYNDTMIVFMSDNGAEGAALEAIPVLGQRIKEAIQNHFDNSLDNIGAWNSFTWLGPLWAQASTAPSRLFKMFHSEGGIHVPAIVKPAKGSMPFNLEAGGFNRSFTTCMDIAPTVLDLIGVALPDVQGQDGLKLHRGRSVHPMTGQTWTSYFGGWQSVLTIEKRQQSHDETWTIWPSDRAIGWELHAQAALRKGPWKIVHLPKLFGGKAQANDDPSGWELFNVEKDPGETTDLASQHPEILEELLGHWEIYVVENGTIWGPNASLPGLPKDQAPELYENDLDLQRAWMQASPGEVMVKG